MLNSFLCQCQVLFKFPDVAGTVPTELSDVVTKFNTLPGITAAFRPYGATGLGKEALMEEINWPDKTDGYTHCLWVLAEDSRALKTYLHSDFHLKEWMPAVKVSRRAASRARKEKPRTDSPCVALWCLCSRTSKESSSSTLSSSRTS